MASLQAQSRSSASSSSNAPMKPCIFLSLFHTFDPQAIEQALVTNALLAESRTIFDLNYFPVTFCATYRNAGSLPLDYVRMLPQYTCMANASEVLHMYEDCILLFRSNEVGADSVTRPVYLFRDSEYYQSFSNCYRCAKSLLNYPTSMFRENPYCSPLPICGTCGSLLEG